MLLKYQQNGEVLTRNSNLSCEPYNFTRTLKKPVMLIKLLLASNTKADFIINMTRLIINWRQFLTMPSDMHVISYAFDYYEQNQGYFSNGWWYLLKDSGNAITSEFVLEEKISVAGKFDFEENPKNFKWLEQNHTFDPSITGIVSPRQDTRWMLHLGFSAE